MNKPAKTKPEQWHPTPDELRAYYQLPDYLPPDLFQQYGFLDDHEGNTWHFYCATNKYGAEDCAAVVMPDGDIIRVALRANLAGEPPPEARPGEQEIVKVREWFRQQGIEKLPEMKGALSAIRLPYRPKQVVFTDQPR